MGVGRGAEVALRRREASAPLVDLRVARRDGIRSSRKDGYDFPGMTKRRDWEKTLVHRHTYGYWCGRCGQRFAGPHAVYTHLAKAHDA